MNQLINGPGSCPVVFYNKKIKFTGSSCAAVPLIK